MRKLLKHRAIPIAGALAMLVAMSAVNAATFTVKPPEDATIKAGDVVFNDAQLIQSSATLKTPTLVVTAGTPSTDATGKTYSAAKVVLGTDLTKGTVAVMTPLALAKANVSLNGAPAPAAAEVLLGQKIVALAQHNGMPVVTDVTAGNALAADNNKSSMKVYLFGDLEGKTLTSNLGAGGAVFTEIADATPAVITVDANKFPIRALASDGINIYAAVAASTLTWEDATAAGKLRGIATLQKADDGKSLEALDATNVAGVAAKAKKLDIESKLLEAPDAGNPVAFGPVVNANGFTTAMLGPNVDMCYSAALGRLYIGLDHMRRDDSFKTGGVLGLTMASATADGVVTLQPVVDGSAAVGAASAKDLLYKADAAQSANVNDRIVGLYYDGTNAKGAKINLTDNASANNGWDDAAVTIKHVRTMRTSTGKDYVIVASSVGVHGAPSTNGVFALGVWPKDSDPLNATKVGQIVKYTDDATRATVFNSLPTKFAEMPKATDASVKITDTDPQYISDMAVDGDTVYIYMNGVTPSQAGVFSSTAIINKTTGAIIGWTPLEREMGAGERYFAGGVDADTGDIYGVTSESGLPTDLAKYYNNINTARVNTIAPQIQADGTVKLSEAIAALKAKLDLEFPASMGGIVSLQVFDQFTPGFLKNKFAMLVAVGADRVAMFQLTKIVNGVAMPETTFTKDTNYFVKTTVDSAALAAIAPLMCTEVSRMKDTAAASNGWLFVGGYKGMAVLSVANGDGWDSFGGLYKLLPDGGATHTQFPGGTDWTFKQLVPDEPITNPIILKMSAVNERMYLLTLTNGVIWFDMAAGKFAAVGNPAHADLAEENVQGQPTDTLVYADMVVLAGANANANRIIIGTSSVSGTDSGIYVIGHANVGDRQFIEKHENMILQFQFEPYVTLNTFPQKGTLYVLTADFDGGNDRLYKYNADGTAVAIADVIANKVGSKVVDFQSSRRDFILEERNIISTMSKHLGIDINVSMNRINTTDGVAGSSEDITAALGIDSSKTTLVGDVVFDGVNSSFLVPTGSGLTANG